MGFEPTTSILARLRSTPELLPHNGIYVSGAVARNRTRTSALRERRSTINTTTAYLVRQVGLEPTQLPGLNRATLPFAH